MHCVFCLETMTPNSSPVISRRLDPSGIGMGRGEFCRNHLHPTHGDSESQCGGWEAVPTFPSSSGSPSSCPANTPTQMKMAVTCPREPRISLGEISLRYMGSTLRAMPGEEESSHETGVSWGQALRTYASLKLLCSG